MSTPPLPRFRYDEETGLYIGVPQMLPQRATTWSEKLTRRQKIEWALAYLRSKL